MEEIDDIFPLFEMLKIHEFAWFPKIKTLTASCFLQNIYFFLNFWKKYTFLMKIERFCQKYKAMLYFYFLHKQQKWLLRNRICQKNLKKFTKIKQIHELQSLPTSKIQCECFFVFFYFSQNDRKWKRFLSKSKKYFQKRHQKLC